MSHWKPIVGRFFKPSDFAAYVGGLTFGAWRPSLIVIHNTGSPTLAQRPKGFTAQHMQNLQHYYRDQLGWSAGPHCFVDQNGIWVFTPLTTSGVHSPSWNAVSWGVETLGNYDQEAFADPVKSNLIQCLAVLHSAAGLTPESLRLHKEDARTSHKTCPGAHIIKADLIAAVDALMDAGDLTPGAGADVEAPTDSEVVYTDVINRSTRVTDKEVASWIPALQLHHDREVAPAWSDWVRQSQQLTLKIVYVFVSLSERPNLGHRQIVIVDHPDAPGAFGYHDLTNDGHALGKVFVDVCLSASSPISATLGHEGDEMAVDSDIEQTWHTAGHIIDAEIGDPPEADRFNHQINGVWVPDFIYPAWAGLPNPAGIDPAQMDFGSFIKAPGELLEGGYKTEDGKQVYAGKMMYRSLPRLGARRERRNRKRRGEELILSEVETA